MFLHRVYCNRCQGNWVCVHILWVVKKSGQTDFCHKLLPLIPICKNLKTINFLCGLIIYAFSWHHYPWSNFEIGQILSGLKTPPPKRTKYKVIDLPHQMFHVPKKEMVNEKTQYKANKLSLITTKFGMIMRPQSPFLSILLHCFFLPSPAKGCCQNLCWSNWWMTFSISILMRCISAVLLALSSIWCSWRMVFSYSLKIHVNERFMFSTIRNKNISWNLWNLFPHCQ